MKLPELTSPEKYTGLYVFDFGEQVAVGYTADEIAVLIESDKFTGGKVYRICRALPDGTMELAGVPREQFQLEDGIFFYRRSDDEARSDFQELCRLTNGALPPCRMNAQRARIEGARHPHLTAIIFPAEFTHDVAHWLNRIGFNAGDLVEGGSSAVSTYYESRPTVVDRRQFWPAADMSRPAEEVLATTHVPVQRKLA